MQGELEKERHGGGGGPHRYQRTTAAKAKEAVKSGLPLQERFPFLGYVFASLTPLRSTQACRNPRRPEDGIRSLRTGIRDDCELSMAPGTPAVHLHTCRENTHKIKKLFFKKNGYFNL